MYVPFNAGLLKIWYLLFTMNLMKKQRKLEQGSICFSKGVKMKTGNH